MKKITFFITLLLFETSIFAQTIFKSKVVDAESGEGIPYASVFFENQNKGTATNIEGEFVLEIPNFPQNIVISHISYEKKIITIKNTESLTIKLTLSPQMLNEVAISGDSDYAKKLVANAYEKAKKERKNTQYGKVFYRQKTKNGEEYNELQEVFYEAKFSTKGVEAWKISNARYGKVEGTLDDPMFQFTNFSYLGGGFRFFSDGKKLDKKALALPIGKISHEYYEYELKTWIRQGDREIAIISFFPKKGRGYEVGKGELYIDTKNYWIYRVKAIYFLGSEGVNTAKNVKVENQTLTFDVYGKLNQQGNWLIDRYQVETSMDFINAATGTRKNAEIQSTLFFYEYDNTLKSNGFKDLTLKTKDLEKIRKIPYDSVFWKNNPIIKRTPLEEKILKDFESKKLIGNMFDLEK